MKPLPSGMPRQQVVLAPDAAARASRSSSVSLRLVAADDVERLAVGAEEDRVRAVLAAAVDLAQQLDLVEHVVAVGVADAVQPAARTCRPRVDDDVQAVERPEQALGLADRRRRSSRPWCRSALPPIGGRRDAVELAVLVGDDEPALGVDGTC